MGKKKKADDAKVLNQFACSETVYWHYEKSKSLLTFSEWLALLPPFARYGDELGDS